MEFLTIRKNFRISRDEYIPAGTALKLRHPFSPYDTFQAIQWKEKVVYIHSSFFTEIMESEPTETIEQLIRKRLDKL